MSPTLAQVAARVERELDYPRLGAVSEPAQTYVALERTPRVPRPRGRRVRSKDSELPRHVKEDRIHLAREVLSALHAVEAHLAGKENVTKAVSARFEQLAAKTGVEESLRLLKELSAKARTHWILNQGTDTTAQFSFVGRALPVGTPVACKEALKLHAHHLSEEFKTDKEFLDRASAFASRWAKGRCTPSSRMASPDLPTLSGCSEATVRTGGLRAFVLEKGMHPAGAALFSSLPSELPYQDVLSLANDISLVNHGLDLYREGLPPSKAICLSERGLKTRVITKSPAALHLLGHVPRKRLLAALKKDIASASPLIGVKDDELLAGFVGARAEVVVSTDLKAASDLLPLDLMGALVDGFALSGRFTNMEIDTLRLLVGGQEIDYDASTGIPSHRSKRGILMGLPTTWALLSLVHLFWWNEAVRRVAQRRRTPMKVAFEENIYRICGDDALMVGWADVAAEYKLVLKACGGVASPGKHFECVGPRKRGVFLERLYEFQVGPDGRVTGGFRNSAIPLRGLVRPDAPDAFREIGSQFQCTPHLKMLFAVDSIWSQHPGGQERLRSFVEREHPILFRVAKDLDLPVGIPLFFGGSGIPSRLGKPLSVKALRRKAQVILLRSKGLTMAGLLRGIVDSTWGLADVMSKPDIQDFELDGTVVYVSASEKPPEPHGQLSYVHVGSRVEFLDAVVASTYRDLVLSLGASRSQGKLSERRLKRAVKDWVRDLPHVETVERAMAILDNPPEPDTVWIRRTRGPAGDVLYPRWVKETRASEAHRRATLVGATRL